MNNARMTIVVAWRTRNKKRHAKALLWCRDFGLAPIIHTVAIGKLHAREETRLLGQFHREFIKKTDAVFSFRICQTCYSSTGISAEMRNAIDTPTFELVQITASVLQSPKIRKKQRK